MSYYANSRESDVYIYKENFEKIIDAVHRDYQYNNDVTSIGKIFQYFGLTAEFNQRGDIDGLGYEYAKFRVDEMEEFFSTIAPFMEEGSYIAFEGADSSLWAYYFNGQSWKEYSGEVTFPGMPMCGPSIKRKTNGVV